MNIVAIIQARTGSTRLPGKVLMDISGKPMLWHVVQRVKAVRNISAVIIATSDLSSDDQIGDFCKEYNINCFRGSEQDVLDRYYQCAKEYQADIIVRITSDCPLLDPDVTAKVVDALLQDAENIDAAFNTLERTYPRGLDVEVVHFYILEKCWKETKDILDREHVLTLIYKNLENYKIASVKNDENFSHLRWTVDELTDWQFVVEVYNRLYKEGELFGMDEVLKVLKDEPALITINKNVQQKKLKIF